MGSMWDIDGWASVAVAMGPVVAALRLQSAGSVAMAHRLNCPVACGIFLDQGSEPVSPALACRIFATGPPEKSFEVYFSYTHFLESFFYQERMLNFFRCFFIIYWDDHMIFVFVSINVVYHIY